ncbi:hypothetical protein MRX96_047211 [Rhipicephalus microplus]
MNGQQATVITRPIEGLRRGGWVWTTQRERFVFGQQQTRDALLIFRRPLLCSGGCDGAGFGRGAYPPSHTKTMPLTADHHQLCVCDDRVPL